MLAEEYTVKLTLAGHLEALEVATQEYTRSLSELQRALVVSAKGIAELEGRTAPLGSIFDASDAWWTSLEDLSRGERFVVLTRMARAGIDTPERYPHEEV